MSTAKAKPLPKRRAEFVPFTGGLDQSTPAYEASPSTCRLAQNWEVGENGGFRSRITSTTARSPSRCAIASVNESDFPPDGSTNAM